MDDLTAKLAKSEAEASELRRRMAEQDAVGNAKYAKLAEEVGVLQTKIADRDKNIANLGSRIDQVTRDSSATGTRKSNIEAELAGLRSELDAARQERQREVARLEKQNGLLDKELAEKRAREADAQRLLEEVERYRRQVADLMRRTKPPDNRPKVIVPSF
jgi:chromosome segregation ATPase